MTDQHEKIDQNIDLSLNSIECDSEDWEDNLPAVWAVIDFDVGLNNYVEVATLDPSVPGVSAEWENFSRMERLCESNDHLREFLVDCLEQAAEEMAALAKLLSGNREI